MVKRKLLVWVLRLTIKEKRRLSPYAVKAHHKPQSYTRKPALKVHTLNRNVNLPVFVPRWWFRQHWAVFPNVLYPVARLRREYSASEWNNANLYVIILQWASPIFVRFIEQNSLFCYLQCANIIVSAGVKKWCQITFVSYCAKIPFRMVWRIWK